jgi:carboxypeptidase family protein/TonB-dependent receptor-like protein
MDIKDANVKILVLRVVIFALVSICLEVPAIAQLGTGTINGTVQDDSGAVIPGVSVTLSNPGVVGGNQNAITDARGAYQFLRLVPSSTYGVKAELPGFRPAARNNIVINSDVNVRVDLTLEVGTLQEGVTVSGEAPLLDTTAAIHQQVLSREVLDTLPTGNDLWSIAKLVPSVTVQTYDVGGGNSFHNQNLSAHGSGGDEIKYLIDGMDVSHGGGSGSSSVSYFDVYMFEEVNYGSGNNSAEMAQGGVVYNMVSKTGTNAFHGSFRAVGTTSSLQSDNLSATVRGQLLANVPANVLAANPNPKNGIVDLYDYGLSLSGPIVRNKLWFTTTGKLNPLRDEHLGSYEPNGQQLIGVQRMRNASFKISWQATHGSQLHFMHNWNRKGEMNFCPGSETSTVYCEARSTQARDQRIKISQLRWTATLSSKAVLDVAGSYHHGPYPVAPNPEVKPGDIPHFDLATSTWTVAAGSYQANFPTKPVFVSSLTYVVQAHNLKFGYQYDGDDYRTTTYSMSGLVARYRSGVPDSVQTNNTPVTVHDYTKDNAVYVQDGWKASRKLTINMGLRLEKVSTWFKDECQGATVFIAEQCFKGAHTPDSLDLAPRFALIYDITGDGKTAFKIGANRYWPGIGVGLPLNINPLKFVSDTRSWVDQSKCASVSNIGCDLNGDLIPQLNELGPSTGFNLGTTNRFNPKLKRPYVNELDVELQRQILGDVVANLAYFHRERKRNIGQRNLAVPTNGYAPIQVTEATSGRTVTVYNQDPATRGKFDVLFDNAPQNDTWYNGVDMTLNKRMSKHWMVMGGLTLSKNQGRQDQTADLNNPNIQFSQGLFQNDVPVVFKMSAVYELPYEIKLSGNMQHFTGFPEDTTVLVTASTVSLTQVSQSIRVEPRGTTRLPNTNMTDLSLKKTIKVPGNRTVEPAIDIFNVFNAAPIQLRIAQLGPTYQRPSSVLGGRLVRFNVNMSF